ncbi:MAG TPA: hypothetical protein PKD19_03215 [Candidatus Saccharibacteria bacterium]|nr:hypothetical protein [Candidatus Saccharibacteria bacterium]HMR38077.1 hypothetical protein [Candidatus Saccharibacteria bacterium]
MTKKPTVELSPEATPDKVGDVYDFNGNRMVGPDGKFLTNDQMNQLAFHADETRAYLAEKDDEKSTDGLTVEQMSALHEEILNQGREEGWSADKLRYELAKVYNGEVDEQGRHIQSNDSALAASGDQPKEALASTVENTASSVFEVGNKVAIAGDDREWEIVRIVQKSQGGRAGKYEYLLRSVGSDAILRPVYEENLTAIDTPPPAPTPDDTPGSPEPLGGPEVKLSDEDEIALVEYSERIRRAAKYLTAQDKDGNYLDEEGKVAYFTNKERERLLKLAAERKGPEPSEDPIRELREINSILTDSNIPEDAKQGARKRARELRQIIGDDTPAPVESGVEQGPSIDDDVQKNPEFWKAWNEAIGAMPPEARSNLSKEQFEAFMQYWKDSQEQLPPPPSLTPEQVQRMQELSRARDNYAEETAKDRKRFWGRFLRSENPFLSKFIKKIPGVTRCAEFFNNRFTKHEDMDQAREAYDSLSSSVLDDKIVAMRAEVQAEGNRRRAELLAVRESITEEEYTRRLAEIEAGESAQSLRAKELTLAAEEDILLEAKIVEKQGEVGAKASRFSNWWARQATFKDGFWKGLGGSVKKAGVLLAAGAAAGATITVGGMALGIASPFVAAGAAVAGGGVGGVMGLNINRRKANSYTENLKKNPNAKTHAQEQSEEHLAAKATERAKAQSDNEYRNRIRGNDEQVSSADAMTRATVDATELQTSEVVKANRNRLLGSISIGASGGRLGFAGVDAIHNALSPSTPDAPKDPFANSPKVTDEQAKEYAKLTGWQEPVQTNGGDIPSPETIIDAVPINTNGAPEHALHALAEQLGVGNISGGDMDRLIHEGYKLFGDNFLVDGAGNPVDLTNFKRIGIGFQDWDKDIVVNLSEQSRDWFEQAVKALR